MNSTHRNVITAIVFCLIVLPLFLLSGNDKAQKQELDLDEAPYLQTFKLAQPKKVQDYFLFDLPEELSSGQVFDVLYHENALWLGTAKGLVRIQDEQLSVFRQYKDWSFEKIKELVSVPDGIAMQVYVSNSITSENEAGTFLLNTKTQNWQRLGSNVLAQVWMDGNLYQAGEGIVRLNPEQGWRSEKLLESVCESRPAELRMKNIGGELWLTGIGRATASAAVSSIGCGVLRYDPKTGQQTLYKTSDGLVHNSTWDIAGDAKEIYVSHSIKHSYLSRFDYDDNRFASMHNPGSGNRIVVSDKKIWLSSAFASRPFIIFDRESYEGRSLGEISNKEYVSALTLHDGKIWFGTYVKQWEGSSYTVKSRIGYIKLD